MVYLIFGTLGELAAEINALGGEVVQASVQGSAVKIAIKQVVAMSNFKALAGFGTYDSKSRSVTLKEIDKSLFKKEPLQAGNEVVYEMVCWSEAASVDCDAFERATHIFHGDKGRLMALVKKLGGGKAKTFKTIAEAKQMRKVKPSAVRRHEEPETCTWCGSDFYGDGFSEMCGACRSGTFVSQPAREDY